MSLFLLTRPGDGQGEREPFATAWWMEAVSWIDERLALLESSDPKIDLVHKGQSPPTGSVAWAEVYSLDITPRRRATGDGANEQASVSLVVTCMAGQALLQKDRMASWRVAGLVWSVLSEYKRVEVAAEGPGAARKLDLYLGVASVGVQVIPENRSISLPAVTVDAGRLVSGPAS